ncbi:MAG: DNA repair protein RecN [Prevotellaceae bacterium]|jgi:DNA repair protein RecN (Recombination protein N)|nr:DNA repair protein RecN [Prevotellaceae bacterium]
MLKLLNIRNFVLIDEADIGFEDGFSVITGETGAGKSVILGALSLVLGERADSKSIQSGKEKCIIEAVFDISAYHLKDYFEENDLEYNPVECLLRRELYSSGKSRAFINDTPVQLSLIKTLGNKLIDIHSQHQNLLLADTQFQLNAVDLIAQLQKNLSEYKNIFRKYSSVNEEINELIKKSAISRQEEDFIRFQHEELSAIKLQAGEQAELERELELLTHSEDIKLVLYKLAALLNGEDGSVLSKLKETITSIEYIIPCFSKAEDYRDRLKSAYIELNDIASEANLQKDEIEYDPERLNVVNERLSTIYLMQQKHKVSTVEELIEKCNAFAKKLRSIESFDEEIEKLKKQQQELWEVLIKQATELTQLRKKAVRSIEKETVGLMVALGITNTRFEISFSEKEKPSITGLDDINFLFSANKNEELKPVAQTASGGEISRLMLCIKSIIAGFVALPTIIFDEIDAGVSGEIADKMAGIMQSLGNKMQVITITHLPQIAARGKLHYFVYKEDTEERTHTRIRRLSKNERTEEIARMLSGAKLTPAAIENAKSLLS